MRCFTDSWLVPGHERDRVGRKTLRHEGFAHDVDEHHVGVVRRRAAAQQRDVAALEAEHGGVDGDVGPCLVDHADDAERHAHLPHGEAVRQREAAHDLADRVGQGRDVAHGVGDRVQPVGREGQPVDDRGVGAVRPRRARRRAAFAATTRSVAASSASAIATSAASFVARGSERRVTARLAAAAGDVEDGRAVVGGRLGHVTRVGDAQPLRGACAVRASVRPIRCVSGWSNEQRRSADAPGVGDEPRHRGDQPISSTTPSRGRAPCQQRPATTTPDGWSSSGARGRAGIGASPAAEARAGQALISERRHADERHRGQRRATAAVEGVAVDDLDPDDRPVRQARGLAVVGPQPQGEGGDGARRPGPPPSSGPRHGRCSSARTAGRGARG